MLKLYGQYVKRLSFPDYVPTPSKLTALLQHCFSLVELCIPTRKLSPDKLKKIIQPLGKLQSLDILWTDDIYPLLMICNKLKKLTVRVERKPSERLNSLQNWSWLDQWISEGFLPQTINVVVGSNSLSTHLV